MTKMNQSKVEKIRKKIKLRQDGARFEHTVGVMYTAAALAMRYGGDMEKAYLAGLLHDCAKHYTGEKKVELCEKYKLPITKAERDNPGLLHAKLGAYIADYIEPNRNQAPKLDYFRRLAFEDIDECLYQILEASLAYLETRNEVIDPMTEQTYIFYKKQLKN